MGCIMSRRVMSLAAVALLCVMMIHMIPMYAKSVVVEASGLKDEYRKGETLTLYVSVLNNKTGGTLTVEKLNISIWRIEKRYTRWRNVERVYNRSREIDETIEKGQVLSIRIQILLDFTPARYNLTVAVYTDESADPVYAVKGYLFWVKSAVEIPPIVWAIVADVIFILVALIIYRKLR